MVFPSVHRFLGRIPAHFGKAIGRPAGLSNSNKRCDREILGTQRFSHTSRLPFNE